MPFNTQVNGRDAGNIRAERARGAVTPGHGAVHKQGGIVRVVALALNALAEMYGTFRPLFVDADCGGVYTVGVAG